MPLLSPWPTRQRLVVLAIIAVTVITLRKAYKDNPFLVHPHYQRPSSVFSSSSHSYRPNGLLVTNPEGAHPIEELIRNAELSWENKLKRASRTLETAVAEYMRRYGRLPPKGFDKWWDYVQRHNVQLPDEYDTIWHDIEPFWGINPLDLRAIQAVQEDKVDSFTLGKNQTFGPGVLKVTFSGDRHTWEGRHLLRGAEEMVGLLEEVKEELPEFRMVVSPHDNPSLVSDYGVMKALVDAARSGQYVDIQRLPKASHLGFVSACPPGSPARLEEVPLDTEYQHPPKAEKTFIHDHRSAMDICLHPHLFQCHSQFLPYGIGPSPQPPFAAQLAYCTTTLHHDIRPPSFIAWVEDVLPRENDPEWEEKRDERLYWRGSNTGMHHSEDERWRMAQRARLVSWANEMNSTVDVLLPNAKKKMRKVGGGTVMKKAILNPAIMDVAFTGVPAACDVQYCEYLATQFEWRKPHGATGRDVGDHKYILDVDGNGWSSRFKRLMTSNSLIFKATIYPEWWLDRIQPWIHYVPIQVDLSDLYDAYIFFRGGLYGEGSHDELARQMASAGREWSRKFWRKEDMTAYFYRLILEYARVTSLDRDSMSFSL